MLPDNARQFDVGQYGSPSEAGPAWVERIPSIRVPTPGSNDTPQNRQIDLGLLTMFNSESGETDERINLPKRPKA
jgi:hypothetical protein